MTHPIQLLPLEMAAFGRAKTLVILMIPPFLMDRRSLKGLLVTLFHEPPSTLYSISKLAMVPGAIMGNKSDSYYDLPLQ